MGTRPQKRAERGLFSQHENSDPLPHLHRVFADTQSVPEFDGFVPGARNDLAVVGGEGDAQHILGVANKAARGGSSAGTPRGSHRRDKAQRSTIKLSLLSIEEILLHCLNSE